jgi:hypothetical protein
MFGSKDGDKHFDVKPGQPLTTAIEECIARRADNVSHLHGWRWHLRGFGKRITAAECRQCIQRTGGRVEVLL